VGMGGGGSKSWGGGFVSKELWKEIGEKGLHYDCDYTDLRSAGWGGNVCNAMVRIDTLRIAAGKRKNTWLAIYLKISSESCRCGYSTDVFSSGWVRLL